MSIRIIYLGALLALLACDDSGYAQRADAGVDTAAPQDEADTGSDAGSGAATDTGVDDTSVTEDTATDTRSAPDIAEVIPDVSTDACPVAAARARVLDSNQPWSAELEASPGDTVEFDGTPSHDPDDPTDPNAISRYQWAVVERPEGSTAVLTPDGRGSTTAMFLELEGRYVVELRVFDAGNNLSCNVATITIQTTNNDDIRVEVTWDTPGDEDQNDTGVAVGVDVDLHVLHPRGSWNSSPWDCYWLNIEPDWGPPGREGDPSLIRDDSDGAGPEIFRLSDAEEVTYRVGVYVFNDHGYGPSVATLRVYLRQVLVFEQRSERLERTGAFWDAATIAWPEGRVEPVDTIHDGFPP